MREDRWRSQDKALELRKTLTPAEALLWSKLRRGAMEGHRFRRQHPIDDYIVDFACIPAKLIVEVDGVTHSTPEEVAHDARREAFLKGRGWQILRFQNDDVFHRLDAVVDGICRALPPPSPDGDTSPASG